MTQRIQKAIDVFLDSLNNGTLVAGNCSACAVGNLVADAFGIEYYVSGTSVTYSNYCSIHINGESPTVWSNFFCNGKERENDNLEQIKAMDIICKQTGFTLKELAAIEKTFESTCGAINNPHEEVSPTKVHIKGLAAVVELMMTFDDVQESVEEVFTSKAEAIAV
jgi:hypothetical protein